MKLSIEIILFVDGFLIAERGKVFSMTDCEKAEVRFCFSV